MNDKNELLVNFSCNLSYNIKFTKEQVDECIKLAFENFDEYLLNSAYKLHQFDSAFYHIDVQSIVDKYKQNKDAIKEKFKNIFALLYQVNDTYDEYETVANMIFYYAVEDYIRLNIETLFHTNPNMKKENIVYIKDIDIINK